MIGYGNNEEINCEDEFQESTLRPNWYHTHELNVELPGQSRVEIAVHDHDPACDDIIGSTLIDLEGKAACFAASWLLVFFFFICLQTRIY